MRSRPALVLAALLLATGCTSSGDPEPAPAAPAPTPPPTAPPAPAPPEQDACRRLAYAEALAPTDASPATPCRRAHTARTYAVGTLTTVVDGHLLAVDSRRVQAQVARTCPRRLPAFLGGTEEDRRLTVLRAVWFTPTLAESDAGADWFRCDVIAVAGDEELLPVRGPLEGVLDTPAGREVYGMCGTAAPGERGFERVACARPHTWRAISSVDLEGRGYPGTAAVRDAGQVPCEDAGREVAEDPLDFRWGYEWPTREQWQAGQRYGRCWAPE